MPSLFADLGFMEMFEHGHRILFAIEAPRTIGLGLPDPRCARPVARPRGYTCTGSRHKTSATPFKRYLVWVLTALKASGWLLTVLLQKAVVAVGRSILVIVWHLLSDADTRFVDLGSDFYDTRTGTERAIRNHVRRLQALGYRVTLEPAA